LNVLKKKRYFFRRRYLNRIEIDVDVVSDSSSRFCAICIVYTVAAEEVVELKGETNFTRFSAWVEDRINLATRGSIIFENVELRGATSEVPNLTIQLLALSAIIPR
jgi:hypothetical protein